MLKETTIFNFSDPSTKDINETIKLLNPIEVTGSYDASPKIIMLNHNDSH